jgi:hypothetical protein
MKIVLTPTEAKMCLEDYFNARHLCRGTVEIMFPVSEKPTIDLNESVSIEFFPKFNFQGF